MSLGRQTLGSVADRIGKMLNTCANDPRVAEYVNAATQRLLPMGHWVGTMALYRVCVRNACLTWPREVETIEAYSVNGIPGTTRDLWYEWISNGPGRVDSTWGNGSTLVDRDEACAFDDVRGTNQVLQLYCDNALDAGKTIRLNYYDQYGNKVIGTGGTMGEVVTLVAPPNYASASSVCMPQGLYGVQKPVTIGTVRLYSYDTVLHVRYPLGYYEPSETLPTYRRSLVPGLASVGGLGTCTASQVDIYAKCRYIPVSVSSDWLLIGNIPALEAAVQAVKASEPPADLNASEALLGSALRYLNSELQSHNGDSVAVALRAESSDTWGGGGIGSWN